MKNLKAEMVRYGITSGDIQRVTGLSERTIRDKLNGTSSFTILEAMKIRDEYFPSLRLEYLFVCTSSDVKNVG